MADAVTIDDRDSSVVYSGVWLQEGSQREFFNTSSGTRATGATAVVGFYGTKIAVHGTVPFARLGVPVSSYAIGGDGGGGGSPVEYVGVPNTNSNQYYVKFFESPTLEPGSHTLTITNLGSSGTLWLDYFIVHGGSAPAIFPSSQQSEVPATTESSAPTTAGSSPVPAMSSADLGWSPSRSVFAVEETAGGAVKADSPDGDSKSDSKPNVGAIVGGVLGGLVAVLAAVVLCIWIWRKKRSRNTSTGMSSQAQTSEQPQRTLLPPRYEDFSSPTTTQGSPITGVSMASGQSSEGFLSHTPLSGRFARS